jgi:hypothetical protein
VRQAGPASIRLCRERKNRLCRANNGSAGDVEPRMTQPARHIVRIRAPTSSLTARDVGYALFASSLAGGQDRSSKRGKMELGKKRVREAHTWRSPFAVW